MHDVALCRHTGNDDYVGHRADDGSLDGIGGFEFGYVNDFFYFDFIEGYDDMYFDTFAFGNLVRDILILVNMSMVISLGADDFDDIDNFDFHNFLSEC